MRATPILAAALLAAATAAHAQSDTVINLLGTVEKIDTTSISVQPDAGGAAQSFSLAPNLLVVQNKPATLADIRPNDFVASAAVRGTDGKLHSTELRIFPEAMRGLGEGQRPMNDARQQTMTNATVTGAAIVNGSNDIKVKYAGGESELVVDPGIPVTRIEPGDLGLIHPGTKVRLQAQRTTDGASVRRIAVQ
jgi:hypothetical protein